MGFLAAVLSLVAAAEGVDLTQWAWQAEVPANAGPAGFVRLGVTPEIMDKGQPYYADLRLVDAADELVPFVMDGAVAKDASQYVWRKLDLINRSFIPGKYARIVADFGEPVAKNHLWVESSGEEYCRRVMVEGGNDGAAWERLVEDAWVFRVPGTGGGSPCVMGNIEIPSNTFRYLQFTVYPMEKDPSQIEITLVKAALLEKDPHATPIPVQVKVLSSARDEEQKQSVYELDLGFRHLPVASLRVPVEDPYYRRSYELLGRNSLTDDASVYGGYASAKRETPWEPIQPGVLYRIQEEGKTYESGPVVLDDCRYRYLQLRIHDGDARPLQMGEGFAAERRGVDLIFEYAPERAYRLLVGNPDVSAASFDLAQAVPDLAQRNLPGLTPGKVSAVEGAASRIPWTERNALVIWLALGLGVCVMLGLVVMNLRKVRPL